MSAVRSVIRSLGGGRTIEGTMQERKKPHSICSYHSPIETAVDLKLQR